MRALSAALGDRDLADEPWSYQLAGIDAAWADRDWTRFAAGVRTCLRTAGGAA